MNDDSAVQPLSSKSVAFAASNSSTSTGLRTCDERQPLLEPTASYKSFPGSPTARSLNFDRPSLRTSRSYHSISAEYRARGYSQGVNSVIQRERTWYDNYTTIDFNRDQVLGAVRLENLRSRAGLRGRLAYLSDAVTGWLLCFLGKSASKDASVIDH